MFNPSVIGALVNVFPFSPFQAFVECDHSWLHLLLVMLCLSLASVLMAVPVGFLNRYVGRVKFMIAALILQIGVFATLLAWQNPDPWVYYVIMTFWGFADAILQLELASRYCRK